MAAKYARDYSVPEMLACFLSREIEDGEVLVAGAAMLIPRTAAILAHLTHAPNSLLCLCHTMTNLLGVALGGIGYSGTDFRLARWAECYCRDEDLILGAKQVIKQRFYIGALQIDRYGNSNLIGLGENHQTPRVRGPGSIGTTSMTTYAKCYYLLVNSHNPNIFVEKCDFISCVGWGTGGKDARQKLGLPGGGPKYVLTPLCVLDFEEISKQMHLKSVHPGVSVEQVIDNTGFELVMPEKVPATEVPSEEELRLLRNRIDLQGLLRR